MRTVTLIATILLLASTPLSAEPVNLANTVEFLNRGPASSVRDLFDKARADDCSPLRSALARFKKNRPNYYASLKGETLDRGICIEPSPVRATTFFRQLNKNTGIFPYSPVLVWKTYNGHGIPRDKTAGQRLLYLHLIRGSDHVAGQSATVFSNYLTDRPQPAEFHKAYQWIERHFRDQAAMLDFAESVARMTLADWNDKIPNDLEKEHKLFSRVAGDLISSMPQRPETLERKYILQFERKIPQARLFYGDWKKTAVEAANCYSLPAALFIVKHKQAFASFPHSFFNKITAFAHQTRRNTDNTANGLLTDDDNGFSSNLDKRCLNFL